ncbi:MAG TPA: hypothetical protein VNI83_10555, partial [Vicinamibacterales bacterium]|nr:hypothetical protein [Vicinamibacterales bacterium]
PVRPAPDERFGSIHVVAAFVNGDQRAVDSTNLVPSHTRARVIVGREQVTETQAERRGDLLGRAAGVAKDERATAIALGHAQRWPPIRVARTARFPSAWACGPRIAARGQQPVDDKGDGAHGEDDSGSAIWFSIQRSSAASGTRRVLSIFTLGSRPDETS